jgi:FkbM family methyltransferase
VQTSVLTRHLRLLQTYLPWAGPLKFAAYNLLARHTGLGIEPEFRILTHLTGIACAVDVGGNRGQSIIALQRLAPGARVVSFEPIPDLASWLSSAFSADPQVAVHNLALSSEAGEAELFVPVYRGFVFDGIASLDPRAAAEWLNAERIAWFDPARVAIRRHKVLLARLDSFGLDADFIKVDVQGHELDVLKGASQTLSRRPAVMLESVSLEIVRYLSQFGLKPYHLIDGKLVIVHSSVNTIFLTDDHVAQTGLPVSRVA